MALLSQVSTSYPRVPRDSFARTWACFLIIQLSGYGQFMLSTSFLPLHRCWSLHCIIYSKYLCNTIVWFSCLVFTAVSFIQQTCKVFSDLNLGNQVFGSRKKFLYAFSRWSWTFASVSESTSFRNGYSLFHQSATGAFISIDKFTKFCSRLRTEHYMHMINVMVLLYHRSCYRISVLFVFMQFISHL